MSTISAAIEELSQTGKTPSENFKLLKPRVSGSCVYKTLKCLRETGSTLPKVRSTNPVQEWCYKNMASFWTKELWPPSSTDLNPMDIAVWSILESNACSSYHPSVT